jgi:predicted dehydrogenase
MSTSFQHHSHTRRAFLRASTVGTVALAQAPLLWGQAERFKGANERVRVAVIGIHGMGQNHVAEYSKLPNVEVAALCDVDQNLFGEVIRKRLKDKATPKTYTDLRRLYEDKSIDAVSVVTPNHWHALAAIWAIQAGKHVSVEKPCCHNFHEGRKLVEAAAKYPKIVVQDGAEQRSNPCAQSMAQFLREGGLGEVYMAKGICYKRRDTILHTPDEPVPAGVDYDLWLGPAAKRPFSRNRFHYNWHWHWDYGNGDIGNQGVHEMDIARWGLGVTLPTRVCAMGGHVMFQDDQQTPNVLLAVFEFPNPAGGGDKKKLLQFEVRHWYVNRELDLAPEKTANSYMTSAANVVGNLFFGSKGYLAKNVNEWRAFLGPKLEPGPTGQGEANHYRDFIEAIRAGDPARAHGDIREGFYTCALVHLANISYRLGRSLEFDPEKMEFRNDAAANAMLTRDYRAPFIVPDRV